MDFDITDKAAFLRSLRHMRSHASYQTPDYSNPMIAPKVAAKRLERDYDSGKIEHWTAKDGVYMVYFKTGGHCFYL